MGENVFEIANDEESSTKISKIKASNEDPEIAVIDTKGLLYDVRDFCNELTNAIKSEDKNQFHNSYFSKL